ncbi:hypothetical protein ABK040_005789 [Willaertia magna]
MCIVGILQNVHPHFPLILVDNRDEVTVRPTDPNLQEITTNNENNQPTTIILCKDQKESGTWMGLNKDYKNLIVLTNSFGKSLNLEKDKFVSRGLFAVELIVNNFNKKFEGKVMNGFNLLIVNLNLKNNLKIFYVTNRDCNGQPLEHCLISQLDTSIENIPIVSNTYLNDKIHVNYNYYKLNHLRNLLKQTAVNNTNCIDPLEMLKLLEQTITNRITYNECWDHYENVTIKDENIIDIKVILKTLQDMDKDNFDESNAECLLPKSWVDILHESKGGSYFKIFMDTHYNIFVNRKEFKTRSQTIVMLDKFGTIYYCYRDVDDIFLDNNNSTTRIQRNWQIVTINNNNL